MLGYNLYFQEYFHIIEFVFLHFVLIFELVFWEKNEAIIDQFCAFFIHLWRKLLKRLALVHIGPIVRIEYIRRKLPWLNISSLI